MNLSEPASLSRLDSPCLGHLGRPVVYRAERTHPRRRMAKTQKQLACQSRIQMVLKAEQNCSGPVVQRAEVIEEPKSL